MNLEEKSKYIRDYNLKTRNTVFKVLGVNVVLFIIGMGIFLNIETFISGLIGLCGPLLGLIGVALWSSIFTSKRSCYIKKWKEGDQKTLLFR